jgi:hypothetical protein
VASEREPLSAMNPAAGNHSTFVLTRWLAGGSLVVLFGLTVLITIGGNTPTTHQQ